MGPDLHLQWALLCLLAVSHLVVQSVSAEDCVFRGNNTVYQKTGKFGNTLTLNAEVEGDTFLSQWSRTIFGNNGERSVILIVTYNGTHLVWRDESYKNDFKAFYTQGNGSSKTSFKLEFKRLTCQDRGEFFCKFFTIAGTCKATFNVNITADPLPPVIKNFTVEAAVGSEVTVLCEANIGYPAGDIAWYYVPNDGGFVKKLYSHQDETTDAGDCRMYSKSKLMYTVKKEDHLAKLTCSSRDYLQRVKHSAQVEIQTEGVDITPRTTTTTAFREPPSVSNITQTDAVLLVDFRDPIGQAPSISYNIKCVDSPDQRLAVNIDLEKTDETWGQGTARFTLSGLSPGQLYKCEATSQTSIGRGWTDQFGFITQEKEKPRRLFQWQHALLPSAGVLVLLGTWFAQRH